MKTSLTILLSVLMTITSIAQTSLSGKITDAKSGEALIGANIVLEKNGAFAAGTTSDLNGVYQLAAEPGTYKLKISYIGYALQVEEVVINTETTTKQDAPLSPGLVLEEVVVVEKGYLVEKCRLTCCLGVNSTEVIKIDSVQKNDSNDSFNQSFQIYPNPTINHVYIDLQSGADLIRLVSLTGRTLKTIHQPESGKRFIDLSDLPAGVYLVQFQKGADILTKRLVIAKP